VAFELLVEVWLTAKLQNPSSITRANRCDPHALEANRVARMTGKQRILLFLSAVPGCFLLTGPPLVLSIHVWAEMLTLFWIDLLFLAFLLINFRIALRYFRKMLDALMGELHIIQGKIVGVAKDDGETQSYWYHIGDLVLEARKRGYEALEADQIYVVYYTPRSKRLMNIEPYMTSIQGQRFAILSENAPGI
jgi:hypothetical protein